MRPASELFSHEVERMRLDGIAHRLRDKTDFAAGLIEAPGQVHILRHGTRRLAGPSQQTHRVPSSGFRQNLPQQIRYRRVNLVDPLSPSTNLPHPAFPRVRQFPATFQFVRCFGNRRP